MLISRKGRYSVRALAALAYVQQQNDFQPVRLARIAEIEDLPLYYIEQLFNKLRRGGIVKSIKGPGGGYSLSRCASEISLLDILMSVGETEDESECEKSSRSNDNCNSCYTRYIWDTMTDNVKNYLSSIHVSELVDKQIKSGRSI